MRKLGDNFFVKLQTKFNTNLKTQIAQKLKYSNFDETQRKSYCDNPQQVKQLKPLINFH